MNPVTLEAPSGAVIIRRTLYGPVSDERFIREAADLAWRAQQLSTSYKQHQTQTQPKRSGWDAYV